MIAFLYFVILRIRLSILFRILAFTLSIKIKFRYERLRPFECGFFTTPEFRPRISLHFFLIALIFLIFDLELIFLFPFLIKTSNHSSKITIVILEFFLVVLRVGTIYE